MPKGCVATWKQWPKTVFCIIGNEFCERFSFYGMRAILTLYALNVLKFSNDNSTVLFHVFTVFAYTTPLFGSILADSYIGKFHTILWISLLYAGGQVMLSVASAFGPGRNVHIGLDLASLAVIAVGTGGIKPCVAAFGADQFKLGQERLISIYFSVFYFAINAGSTISMFLTPILRTQSCQDRDTCYPLAFGVPAGLMVVATGIFLLGSYWYNKKPPEENILVEVIKCVCRALSNKHRFKDIKRKHWLEHYLDNHQCECDDKCKGAGKCHKAEFVNDVKALLRVIVMYVPVPFFWALFDQQGSRWVLQAIAMDGRIWEGFHLLPDQMGTLNAIFIMIFIPISQTVVYPLIKKCGLDFTPLRRMALGGFLAAGSFIIAAMVQFSVNKTLPNVPAIDQAQLSFMNSLPCDATFERNGTGTEHLTLDSMTSSKNPIIFSSLTNPTDILWDIKQEGEKCTNRTSFETLLKPGLANYTVVTKDLVGIHGSNLEKPTEGEGQFKLSVNMYMDEFFNGTIYLCRKYKKCECHPHEGYHFKAVQISDHVTEYQVLKPGHWKLWLPPKGQKYDGVKSCLDLRPENYHGAKFDRDGQGGIFVLGVTGQLNGTTNWQTNTLILVPDNKVSILWQIPQYIVLTAGEILFSITGLEFSYSQAPPSMKSVIQALWLFTVAIGDVIIIVVVESIHLGNLAYEMLLFAGIMIVVMIVFVLLAVFYYEYTYYTREKEENAEKTEPSVTASETTNE